MKTLLAALAAVALLALAFTAPASADPLSDWFGALPGSHVGHLSLVDHADVPNCTVLGPNVAGCETVPAFVSSSTGTGCIKRFTDPVSGDRVCKLPTA